MAKLTDRHEGLGCTEAATRCPNWRPDRVLTAVLTACTGRPARTAQVPPRQRSPVRPLATPTA